MTTPTTTAPVSPAPVSPAPASPAPAGAGSSRLRNGQLRAMVARVLADEPGTGFSAGDIARALGGRSSGAVANALKTLADRGDAVLASSGPLTYRATATTAAAATFSPTTPVPTPATTARAVTGAPGSGSAPAGASRPRRSRPAPATAPTTTAPATTATAPSGAADPAEPVTGPVTRPNGMAYHPRQLSGMPDVTALRKLRAAAVPALLYGPPGTGKTSVVEAAFGDLITVQGDGDTTVADLVGEYTQTPDGRFVFVHGPLVRAMREGRPLFIDDATLVPPTVLAVVYPAMDGRRQIIIKANGGEVIDAASGFYTVAGHNPGVHGAVLTDALSSRFSVQIAVSTDYDLATQLEVDARAVRVARNLATRLAKGEVGWAPQLRELLAFQKIAAVLGPEAAAANLVGAAPEDDRETVASVVRGVFGRPVTPLALGARI